MPAVTQPAHAVGRPGNDMRYAGCHLLLTTRAPVGLADSAPVTRRTNHSPSLWDSRRSTPPMARFRSSSVPTERRRWGRGIVQA